MTRLPLTGNAGVARHRLSDALAVGLLDLIRERRLQPGEQFFSVRVLAEHFEVAVPTLREALRRLEATGAVELRHGSGIYVGPNVDRLVLANPAAGAGSGEGLVQLLAARQHLDPPSPILRLASARRQGLAACTTRWTRRRSASTTATKVCGW